jgi:hypothetical protein
MLLDAPRIVAIARAKRPEEVHTLGRHHRAEKAQWLLPLDQHDRRPRTRNVTSTRRLPTTAIAHPCEKGDWLVGGAHPTSPERRGRTHAWHGRRTVQTERADVQE